MISFLVGSGRDRDRCFRNVPAQVKLQLAESVGQGYRPRYTISQHDATAATRRCRSLGGYRCRLTCRSASKNDRGA
jgi:hypothetical protein